MRVTRADGEVDSVAVASDPATADTDEDGLEDGDEYMLRTHPRSDDTDADTLSDYEEWLVYRSNPTMQDTDGDGLTEPTELFFGTSTLLADTDGDLLSDRDEIFDHQRNPRIADLPGLDIEIGEVSIQIDVRSTFTDQFGRETSSTRSTSSTLERSATSEWSVATSASVTASLQTNVGFEAGFEGASPTAKLSSGFTGAVSTEATFATTAGGSQASNRAFSNSTELGRTDSATSTVERTTEGAQVQVTLTLSVTTAIAMTVRNLEATLLQRDATDRSRYVAVATLLPARAPLEVTLGPAAPTRGPFIFRSSEVFPARAEELMRDPSALFVRISNFDLVDELGRNFTFASQTVAERSGAFVIDYGNGTEERWSVALPSTFDPVTGRPVGLSIEDALRVVGLDRWPGEDVNLNDPAAPRSNSPEILGTYGMQQVDFGGPRPVRILTRVRDVQNSVDLNDPTRTRTQGAFWAVFSDDPAFDPTADFTALHFGPGPTWTLAFVQDQDGDGVCSLEEAGHGSSDQLADTDNDGLTDFFEIRGWDPQTQEVWRVFTDRRFGGYKAYAFPGETDGDGDGLSDLEEFTVVPYDQGFPNDPFVATEANRAALDPRKIDTDDDGVTDGEEVNGYEVTLVNWPDSTSTTTVTVQSDPLRADTDGDGVIDGVERRFGGDPRVPDAGNVVDTDRDGLPDAIEEQGWITDIYADPGRNAGPELEVLLNHPRVKMTSNPADGDTDNDGLSDYVEFHIGTNPKLDDTDHDLLLDQEEWNGWNTSRWARLADECRAIPNCDFVPPDGTLLGTDPARADSDRDRVNDGDEIAGWVVTVDGQAPGRVATSDPLLADTDGDGWDDRVERDMGTNPSDPDTDGDGLADPLERENCGQARCRDPLRADRRVEISHTSLSLSVTWPNGWAWPVPNWFWAITIRDPRTADWLLLSTPLSYVPQLEPARAQPVAPCNALTLAEGDLNYNRHWGAGLSGLSAVLVVANDDTLVIRGSVQLRGDCDSPDATYQVTGTFGGQGATGTIQAPIGNSDVVHKSDVTSPETSVRQNTEFGILIRELQPFEGQP